MSRISAVRMGRATGFPRVSGDEPGLNESVRKELGFSPRERGWAGTGCQQARLLEVFPA